ncbi:MAG: two-component system sensor histidine kinase NtrB [Opitutales bacterium]
MDILNDSSADNKKILLHTIEASTLPYTVAKPHGNRELIYVNPAFTECTQYTSDESIDRNCSFLQGEQTDQSEVDRLRKGLDTFTPVNLELINYRKDGTPFWNYLRISPVFSDTREPIAFVGIQADVSARRNEDRIARERQKFEALGTASANISHEIKNALQPLFLLKDLLEDWQTLDPATIDRTLNAFGSNLEIADKIVRGFLKYSRQGEQTLSKIKTEALFPSISDFLKSAIPNRINFTSHFDELLADHSIEVPETAFQQVVLNLANNAADAITNKGSIEMRWSKRAIQGQVSNQQTLLSGNYLCVDIIDDGCGLPEGKESSIFNAFFSTKPPDKGTGIGLSVSREMITEWNGHISAHTTKDCRTCFRILLPLKKTTPHPN